jgi:hypothetical protein
MPGSDNPTIFIYGKVKSGDVTGVYRSNDWGVTWVRADDNQHQWGHLANAGMIEADRNIYGRVYRSTAGMGIPYMDAQVPTAIQNQVFNGDIKLFPNPFDAEITLHLCDSKVQRIQVYTISGALLKTIVPSQQTIRFGEELNSGAYLVKVVGEKNSTVQKIIKR